MTTDPTSDDLDPALVAILATLHEAAHDPSGKPWSLSKVAKRTQLPMSTLRRVLTQLDAAGLTATTSREDGTGSAALTDEGRALCAQLAVRRDVKEAGRPSGPRSGGVDQNHCL